MIIVVRTFRWVKDDWQKNMFAANMFEIEDVKIMSPNTSSPDVFGHSMPLSCPSEDFSGSLGRFVHFLEFF